MLVSVVLLAQATPRNLYEQLCEVNQEWHKHRATAQKMGLVQAKPLKHEQDLLSFHIRTLGQIFRQRPIAHLSPAQQRQRHQHLKVLDKYWQRRDCPRNDYLPYRNPVFIDHEGRYCAVGYLMLKSGKGKFCKAVQKNSNFIYIRQIKSADFDAWQSQSGLSIEELAWIQPGYTPAVRLEQIHRLGVDRKPRFVDSLQATRIYNAHFDRADMFGFQRMFWGTAFRRERALKKYKKYKGKPDWEALRKTHGSINALTVYQSVLYAAVDTTLATPTGSVAPLTKIVKWHPQKKWVVVHKIIEPTINRNHQNVIYTFFSNRGKLYAGGGFETLYNDATQQPPRTHSYLVCFNGRSWKKVKQEYGGIIFGLIYKNGKRYLGTVINGMAGNTRAPIHPTAKVNK
ncbi:hypothetical protein M23134_04966 [Microscilla marina ATCC 23134]|uniref:Uncharacterized protein n=2 Tax=Microscilla marina TaxID=1027 RepID=A1ZXF9_MICM2|nr:hypothetical protein M23134_04966 [Microscilla marina ATCC 23134]